MEKEFEEGDEIGGNRVAFGITVLEQVLLAIIHANPADTSKTAQQRLNSAMIALIGTKASPNPLPNDRDDRALVWMGGERHADIARQDMYAIDLKWKPNKKVDPPSRPRSDLALAKAATELFFYPPNESVRKSITDRLREKFSGSYARKQGKSGDVLFEETYIYRAAEHDYVGESVESQSVELICGELKKWGIKTRR